MTTTVPFSRLTSLAGTDLGRGEWMVIDQARINTFADATDDHQWIHVDESAAKDGPFGGTVAHGYLTLALIIPLWTDLLEVEGVTTKVNYGLNKVRFPAPVPAGSRVRAAASVAEVAEVGGGGVQLTVDVTVEIENSDKPACVAQPVFRFYA
ncbi:MaoC family dehydratase [Saccharomonospora saliphila]|uniref:MaoC family dehydratase n=1 Tax=Saccharomonospora saliphila TaxID=369829 RepID=UPI0003790B47|nr:MaoC family dehydratase [Saccharomonospora saliphila]